MEHDLEELCYFIVFPDGTMSLPPSLALLCAGEARAAARLECLEETEEKEALLTLVRGVSW